MTSSEVETLVLDAVKRHTLSEKVGGKTRFAEDLHLSETSRQMLFASMVESFNAKGVSLPSRGFFLSHFLTCRTPGDVQTALSAKVFAPAKSETKAAAGKTKKNKSGR